jgi:HptB-dependent secretion and biofilm anti anti-sigma factor
MLKIATLHEETYMSVMAEQSGSDTIIKIVGRFDFNVHQEFRNAYEGADGDFVVDMSQTDYIDSSALGMLLLLREHAGGDKASIKITHTNEEIKKILTISNFQTMFNIE